MKINWKKTAKVLGVVGTAAGACSAAAGVIQWLKPEARDMPSEHAEEIKRLVAEELKKAAEKKD